MKYQLRKPAVVLLADGTVFQGKAVGEVTGSAFGEVCFNTGMTGYQEIYRPFLLRTIVVTTNAHVELRYPQ